MMYPVATRAELSAAGHGRRACGRIHGVARFAPRPGRDVSVSRKRAQNPITARVDQTYHRSGVSLHLTFDLSWLARLEHAPCDVVTDSIGHRAYTARIGIPNYRRCIQRHFGNLMVGSLDDECRAAEIPFGFEHFAVVIRFERPTEVALYDNELTIHRGLCDIIARVGPVVLCNAYLSDAVRTHGHRNRFPHLQFHIDRNAKQTTRYSMYTRDPFDEEQRHPRTASTLFTANIVGHLQGIKDGSVRRHVDKGTRASAPLFENEDMASVLGSVVFEQRWDEPEGIGEIAMIDNATVLHASYYRNPGMLGYRIGVRYLAGIEAP
jgi:hypothetical protein